ncbi:hypothetical protein ZWY2020_020186 [Hordeum vulgare]|nr:hypothetical protein ZWY2020_020186 [Hordeum vulgare]
MHHTSGRKGKGSQDRCSLRQSEAVSGRHHRDAGDEGYSVREVPPPRRREGANATSSQDTLPILARIGPRVPHSDNDVRRRLNLLAQWALVEEDGPIGPACFGPRNRGEPFPRGFTLPRDTPKYNGTANREDWLIDYTTAVGIARGNKRVAVRYVPLMLVGSAWTWLNSLPASSANSWVDFEEAFVRNFTGTYKRPRRPCELAMCVQRPDEPLRDYVMRWTELRNSCKAMHEVQAIQYFINDYRDGTLLKHKLMCSEPTSLAVLMAKADKYAIADSAMWVKVTASDNFPHGAYSQAGWRQPRRPEQQADHHAVMPNPGPYALVLDPTFASKRLTCRFSRVLVDGDSSINILYRDTLLKLGLKEKDLQPTRKIQLDVLFGDKAHFR